jgi:hypothetical protein
MRQVILYPGENGFWVAECPSLPGCISHGDTKESAIRNIREQSKDSSWFFRKTASPFPQSDLTPCS